MAPGNDKIVTALRVLCLVSFRSGITETATTSDVGTIE
jgi:hypothetical protein